MKANEPGTLNGSDASNDGIAIMHAGLSVLPFNEKVYLPPVPLPFPAGQPAFKQWTLWPSGPSAAALANLNMYRRLSIYVQDDTRVESVTLQLWGCCLSGPRKDATEEGITAETQKK
jgi:hypothetical protein